MYLNIIRKDLKRKKTMNAILFIFISLAATFIGSSVNNVAAVTTALDSYFEKANVPDYWVCASDSAEADKIEGFIKGEGLDMMRQELIQLDPKKIQINGGKFEYTSNSIVVSDVNNTVTIFDSEDNKIDDVEDGDIYVTAEMFNGQKLEIGDKITLMNEASSKTFILRGTTKDAFFGSAMIGMSRMIVSENDFKEMQSDGQAFLQSIGIFTDDPEGFETKLNSNEFNTIFNSPQSTIKLMYVMDMVMAAVMLIVSACLILISMVILRFTINFTMSEEFREIGVMKAIGIRNRQIRVLYLIKYLIISVAGAVIGFGLSIPLGEMLIADVAKNVIIGGSGDWLINVVCSVCVVAIVLLFGYFCTRRIKRITPIEAIRNGENGQRYKRKAVIRLSGTRMSPVMFLSFNDVLSGIRRFVMLIIIFTLGILLVIVPINTINTLQSDNLVTWFSMAPSEHVMGRELFFSEENDKRETVEKNLEDIKNTLLENNIQADVFMELMFRMNISYDDKKCSSLAFQGMGDITDDKYSYMDGTPPVNSSEIGISHIISDKLGAGIGDTVKINIGSGTREYIVTSIFQTMNNMGEGIRFYHSEELDYSYATGSFGIQIKYTDNPGKKEIETRKSDLERLFPEYDIYTAGGYINHMMGDIAEQLQGLKHIVLSVVICINVLVTVLMVKSFITKEKGEIGMLKSIGFRDSKLILWQTMRIGIVLLISVIIGTIISTPISEITAGQVFKMMGAATIEFEVKPLEVYIIYPLIMFATTILAGFLTAQGIRKICASETSNIE